MTARDVLAAYVESLYNCAPNTGNPLRACQKAAHRIVQGDLEPAALETAAYLVWRLEYIRTGAEGDRDFLVHQSAASLAVFSQNLIDEVHHAVGSLSDACSRALNRSGATFDPQLLDFMKELFFAYEHQRSIDHQMSMTTLDKVLDAFPTSVSIDWVMARPDGRLSIGIAFSEQGFGFGEITLVQTPQGLFLDSECMKLETVKRFINRLLEGAIADYDKDPARHKKYNEVMGRQCGEGCKICREEGSVP